MTRNSILIHPGVVAELVRDVEVYKRALVAGKPLFD
jgi:hypothetical protein